MAAASDSTTTSPVPTPAQPLSSYEEERRKLEEAMKKSQESAQKAYETNQEANFATTLTPNNQLITQNDLYEKEYQTMTQNIPDKNTLLTEFESSRKAISEHDNKLEQKCMAYLDYLQTTTWKEINYQTFSGHQGFVDTETGHIWIVNMDSLKDGAEKPDKELYDELESITGCPTNYDSQPDSYMFPI